eukprot:CAMPEP_0185846772 /NCGR_PEP_ID=MMETSP1354-20130828/2299_1 /TAXON_ID=708628 /ORGANISM="Erythrolobus madagascarensis, Strain CCMP3276" /LENGTH=466 /DNA_ID=CAMNT_0028546977 /DNA_START=295 /DNA_END=1695 /DNA_ORIENTATION=-
MGLVELEERTERGRLLLPGSAAIVTRVEQIEKRLRGHEAELHALNRTVETRVSSLLLRPRLPQDLRSESASEFPDDDSDVEYLFEDIQWMSQDTVRLKEQLIRKLKEIRERMEFQLVEVDRELQLQGEFRPVVANEIESRRLFVTQLYFKVRQETVRKFQAYIRNLKSIDTWGKRRKNSLSAKASFVLRSWLFEHVLMPYPDEEEKRELMRQTGLDHTQICNWFINARVRLWKPMIDVLGTDQLPNTIRSRTLELMPASHTALPPQQEGFARVIPYSASQPTVNHEAAQSSQRNSPSTVAQDAKMPKKASALGRKRAANSVAGVCTEPADVPRTPCLTTGSCSNPKSSSFQKASAGGASRQLPGEPSLNQNGVLDVQASSSSQAERETSAPGLHRLQEFLDPILSLVPHQEPSEDYSVQTSRRVPPSRQLRVSPRNKRTIKMPNGAGLLDSFGHHDQPPPRDEEPS